MNITSAQHMAMVNNFVMSINIAFTKSMFSPTMKLIKLSYMKREYG